MNLEPLRAALRAETDAGVEAHLALVDAECARTLADAEAEARALARQGRREGDDAAAKEGARRHATAARRAREISLQAQQRQIDELQRRARRAILDVRAAEGYPALLERLAQAARDQLGPDAELEVDPPGLGGVSGRAGRTSVDYTLPALVDRTIASLGDELETLWR